MSHGKDAATAQIIADNRDMTIDAPPTFRQRPQGHGSSVESPIVTLQMGGSAISIGSILEEAHYDDSSSFVMSDAQADEDLLQMTRCRIVPAPAVRTRGALWVITPSESSSGISRNEAENALSYALDRLKTPEITDQQVETVHGTLARCLGAPMIRLLCATMGHARLIAPDANILFYRPGGTIIPLEDHGVISCPMRPNDIMMLRDRT